MEIEIEPEQEIDQKWIYLLTILLLISNMTIAILFTQLTIVFSIIGSVSGNMLGFILPAAIYLKILSKRR